MMRTRHLWGWCNLIILHFTLGTAIAVTVHSKFYTVLEFSNGHSNCLVCRTDLLGRRPADDTEGSSYN